MVASFRNFYCFTINTWRAPYYYNTLSYVYEINSNGC